MNDIDRYLKMLAGLGALVFLFYSFSISFLPAGISLGDIIPLILLLVQFLLASFSYFLLFVLSGATFWYAVKLVRYVVRPLTSVSAALFRLVLSLVRLRPQTVRHQWLQFRRGVLKTQKVRVHFIAAIAGIFSLMKLFMEYFLNGFGLPKHLPGISLLFLFIFACMYCYLVSYHVILLYLLPKVGIRRVIQSPLFSFTYRDYLNGPYLYDRIHVGLAIAVFLLCFPGGFKGLLNSVAESAGLRENDAIVLVSKPEQYGNFLKGTRENPCAEYLALKEDNAVRLEGVTVVFHGVGTRSLIQLPGYSSQPMVEFRSEDIRIAHDPAVRTIRNDLIWFRIYLLSGVALQLYHEYLRLYHDYDDKSIESFVHSSLYSDLGEYIERFAPTPLMTAQTAEERIAACRPAANALALVSEPVIEIVRSMQWASGRP